MGIFSNNNGKKSNEMSVNVSSKGVNVIAPETHFKGVIETSAMTQIEGFFEGDVKCENTLHIGKTGKVNGNIVADSIFIDGEIKGDISADRVEIGENGRVYANIISVSFVIHEGARFEGNKKMKIEENTYSSLSTSDDDE